MSGRRVIVLTPNLDAAGSGVGGFALELARRTLGGLDATVFVVPAGASARPPEAAARIVPVQPAAQALVTALEGAGADEAVLHYVGFGYSPDACPAWLATGLADWKRRKPDRRLAVYFHELATEEPWWRRSFWTQPRQVRTIVAIAGLADRLATNCPAFIRRLGTCYGVEETRLLLAPVAATIPAGGETTGAGEAATGLTALVFGRAETRRRAVHAHRRILAAAIESGLLARLIVAGREARVDELPVGIRERIKCVAEPEVDAARMTALARQVDFGLVWNWPPILTKASVFANLCAAGIPALTALRGTDADAGLPGPPAFVACDGSRAGVRRVLAVLADPRVREALRTGVREVSRTRLGWDVVAPALERHFFP